MILTLALAVPLLGALALAGYPRWSAAQARRIAMGAAGASLAALIVAWLGFDPRGPQFQYVVELPWVPSLGVASLGVPSPPLLLDGSLTAALAASDRSG